MSSQAVRFAPQPIDGKSTNEHYNTVSTFHISTGDDEHVQEEFEKQKIGHRRVDKQGEVSYKRVPTNALMGAIQMGIANSIGSLASVPIRDILITDFYMVDAVPFPSNGSQVTPAHNFGDFRFQTYAPIAFRYFRELFSIETADFLHSICFEPLQELSNPGASGSIFYVTSDERFIIKTVQHNEADFLQSLLPSYFMNLKQNPLTLLPKFFGFFCYQRLGKNIRLIVMNNLLPQSVIMHEKYDLKGSTYKRYASRLERSKAVPTLKDLDFVKKYTEGFYLETEKFDSLIKTLERDCLVLQSCKIMDYSLLVGVHRVDTSDGANTDEESSDGATSTSKERTKRRRSRFWDLDSNISPGVFPARNHKGQDIILFLGVIDILQKYRFFKKFEHTWKSILYKADSVSVHNPSFYAERFLRFMKNQVFHSYVRVSPARQKPLFLSSAEKEREDCNPVVAPSHTVQINVRRGNRITGRRSCYAQEIILEKPQKKKVERLFAPENASKHEDQELRLSKGQAVVCLSQADIVFSSCENSPEFLHDDSGDRKRFEQVFGRKKAASESETAFLAQENERTGMGDAAVGSFITRIYIPPSK